MTRFDVLDKLVETGNGYLCTSQVVENGISKPTLAEFVRVRNMGRVAQGVYLAENAWPDELYLLSLSNSQVVFSHETALFLHGLMEREPKFTSVTVKAGYNASHLRKKNGSIIPARGKSIQINFPISRKKPFLPYFVKFPRLARRISPGAKLSLFRNGPIRTGSLFPFFPEDEAETSLFRRQKEL